MQCDYFNQVAQQKKTKTRQFSTVAYGGFVICANNKRRARLLTPAAALQPSSDVTAPPRSQLHRRLLVFSVWRVGGVGQASLPLAHVPVQALRQALEPVVNQVMATDGGHRVAGGGDLDAAEGERQRQGPRGTTQRSGWFQRTEAYQSPNWISCLFLPSNDTQAVFLASGDSVIWCRVKRRTLRKTLPCCLRSADGGGDAVGFSGDHEQRIPNGLQKPGSGAVGPFSLSVKLLMLNWGSPDVLTCSCDKPKSDWLARTEAPGTLWMLRCTSNEKSRVTFKGFQLNPSSSVSPM